MAGKQFLRRMSIAALFCLGCAVVASAATPSGKVLQHVKMPSAIIGQDLNYTIYLPPDYDSSQRTYPVFYLLHGGGDHDDGWVQLGEIASIMDKAIASGEVTSMIVAMPDGQRDKTMMPRTYFTNDRDGGFRWADMFIQEFIPYIEKEYRVRQSRSVRAIGGLSMGGYGALMFSLQNPEMFASTVALSAAVWTGDEIAALSPDAYGSRFGKAFGEKLEGKDRLNEYYRKSNPLALMEDMPAADLMKVRMFFDCGSEDDLGLDHGNAEMHYVLRQKKVPHSFTMRAGGHTWPFWRAGIVEGLKFITTAYRD